MERTALQELAQVRVQAALEDLVDGVVAQALQHLAGQPLGFVGVGAGTGAADGAESGSCTSVVAEADGPRMLWVQDQHLGHLLRLEWASDIVGDTLRKRRPIAAPPSIGDCPAVAGTGGPSSRLWYCTSTSRAVISARSSDQPMRRNCQPSSCGSVASVTP